MEFHIGAHWDVNIFGMNVHMDTLITLWITMAIILMFAAIAVGNIKLVPSKIQAILLGTSLIFPTAIAAFGSTYMADFPLYELINRYHFENAIYNRSIKGMHLANICMNV